MTVDAVEVWCRVPCLYVSYVGSSLAISWCRWVKFFVFVLRMFHVNHFSQGVWKVMVMYSLFGD